MDNVFRTLLNKISSDYFLKKKKRIKKLENEKSFGFFLFFNCKIY